MSIESEQTAESTSSVVTPPGILLRQAREQAGLTQEQVAKELHMTLSRIRAIESDDYTRMNVDTYVRGYLRSYAALLKLDPNDIISAYQQHELKTERAEDLPYPVARDSSPKKLWGFVGLLILLLAGLWLISVWFFDNPAARPEATQASSVAQSAVPTAVEQPALPAAEDSAADIAPAQEAIPDDADSLAASETDAATDAVATETQPNVTKVAEPDVATEQQLDQLNFIFAEECWLEVSDSQGDILATDLQRADSTLSLSGVAPFNVKVGNAPAVSLTLNGVEVEINPPAGTRVMTLSVGE